MGFKFQNPSNNPPPSDCRPPSPPPPVKIGNHLRLSEEEDDRSIMSSYTVYDHDLDDAELWAVIDSAAAVHSSASRSRKSTALRTPTFSPPAPAANSHSNPPRKRIAAAGDEDGRACSDGEVLQEEPWRHSPLIKQSRIYSGRDGSDNQIVLLRRGVGSGPPTTPAAATPSYSSSPVCNNFASPVVESPTAHSLSGRFPSVNLFKQYQNAAMAVKNLSQFCSKSVKCGECWLHEH